MLPRDDVDEAQPATPCDGCGARAESQVWGFNVCYPCVDAWSAAAKASPPVSDADDYEAVCAKYTAWTTAWMASRRTARARLATNAPKQASVAP